MIQDKLSALRRELRREHLAAFIFPSGDPHGSEYVPPRWEGRRWISGFDGSAGTAVVTLHGAALWTDSRYFLAAERQLRGTEYVLMRRKIAGTPTIAEWIASQRRADDSTEVGIDGSSISAADADTLRAALRRCGGMTLRTNLDVLDRLWSDRPGVPDGIVEIHPLRYAGESTASKLRRIRSALALQHADGILVSALDDIAWTLNLRGNDVACNPVFVSYLLITAATATLFIDPHKVTHDVARYLAEQGVSTRRYDDVRQALRRYPDYRLLLDPTETNSTLFALARRDIVVRDTSPIPAMKAIKNEAEIAGFRRSMERDGVAMVRFLRQLLPAVERGGQTERSADAMLTSLRSADKAFRGPSFGTIAGYGEHGAIVHYEATPESDAPLEPHGLLLLDSGAQYVDGTTDITRTIALGPTTEEERRAYTLVLKGHLRLQALCFPDGATGTQLDAVARSDMWAEGINYLHGTGHGVGSRLCVHEGPHQIRMEWRGAPLRAGMTVTDEPGIYVAGRFGVRIENTLLITDHTTTAFGRFLRFEPLTLCPIDTAPIEHDMLTDDDRRRLNDYHALVARRLSPLLNDDERRWLARATAPL